MRIVNLEDFLKLPSGTLYTKFEPCVFGEICIKEETTNDLNWIYSPLLEVDIVDDSTEIYNITNKSYVEGTSFKLDVDCTQRDGLYNSKQLFAVYEKEDLEQLICKLNYSLNRY